MKNRLILYVLTALAGIGALYFFAIEMAAGGIALLLVVALCLAAAFAVKRRL